MKKLALVGGKTYNGNAVNEFKDADPFNFSPANANRRLRQLRGVLFENNGYGIALE